MLSLSTCGECVRVSQKASVSALKRLHELPPLGRLGRPPDEDGEIQPATPIRRPAAFLPRQQPLTPKPSKGLTVTWSENEQQFGVAYRETAPSPTMLSASTRTANPTTFGPPPSRSLPAQSSARKIRAHSYIDERPNTLRTMDGDCHSAQTVRKLRARLEREVRAHVERLSLSPRSGYPVLCAACRFSQM
jgi:hypothetical protein